jgi:hypothetical protein
LVQLNDVLELVSAASRQRASVQPQNARAPERVHATLGSPETLPIGRAWRTF